MSNLKTKCINCDISTTFAPLGLSRVSKEAETFMELKFLGLGGYFSAQIVQNSKNRPKMVVLGCILDVFEDSSILTEK